MYTILGFITIFRILTFCLRLASELERSLLWFFGFVSKLIFHLSDGTKCMPRYMYGSFWVRVGKF